MNKCNWEETQFPLKKMIGKKIEKNNVRIVLNVLYKKTKNISCLCSKTYLKLCKTSYSFNDSKWRKMALSCRKKNYQHQ